MFEKRKMEAFEMLPSTESDPAPWEVLRTEYLFRQPWLTLRRDCVRVPTGAVIDEYYVWEYPPWVNVVGVTEDDQLVLVRQYRHGLSAVHYELPGGTVDPADADPLAAAQRELLEETGFSGGEWSPLMTCSANAGTQNNLTHSFLASGVQRTAAPEPEEGEDLRPCLMPFREIRRMVEAGDFVQAQHLAPLLKYLLARL
jgi:8-oxo-dGTP pyrophosphatase MutT (NUDIX family)